MNENFKITHINSECKDASRCEPHGEIGKVSYFPNENFKDCGSCRNNSDNWNVDIGETQGTCDICSGKRSNKNFKDWKILAISILDEATNLYRTLDEKDSKQFFTFKLLEILKEAREKMEYEIPVSQNKDTRKGHLEKQIIDLAILDEIIKKYGRS